MLTSVEIERFWSKVRISDPDDCWEWQAARLPRGYGITAIKRRNRYAHRVAFELAGGAPIPKGRIIMHTCDNPPCVNPRHLRVGTQADNVQDAIEKGRWKPGGNNQPRGTAHGSAKLTEASVMQLRARADGGASWRQIASEFNISDVAAEHAALGKTWAHVPGALAAGRERPCRHCGTTFIPSNNRQHYCSNKHRVAASRLRRAG